MNGLNLPGEYATLLRLEKRLTDLELLVDRLIQNEKALYQGLVLCETRLTKLEDYLQDADEMPAAPAGQAN